MPYIVVKDGRCYLGTSRKSEIDPRLLWTRYKKEARRYVKRAWAEKAAAHVAGKVEEVQK